MLSSAYTALLMMMAMACSCAAQTNKWGCDPTQGCTEAECEALSNSGRGCVVVPGKPDFPEQFKSWGVGADIMLVFFVALAMPYLVIGIIINSTFNGKSGVEMIPNYPFWAMLFGLIQEGFRYTVWSCSNRNRTTIDGYRPLAEITTPIDPKNKKGYNTHI
eukprot:gene17445-35232_t